MTAVPLLVAAALVGPIPPAAGGRHKCTACCSDAAPLHGAERTARLWVHAAGQGPGHGEHICLAQPWGTLSCLLGLRGALGRMQVHSAASTCTCHSVALSPACHSAVQLHMPLSYLSLIHAELHSAHVLPCTALTVAGLPLDCSQLQPPALAGLWHVYGPHASLPCSMAPRAARLWPGSTLPAAVWRARWLARWAARPPAAGGQARGRQQAAAGQQDQPPSAAAPGAEA